MRASRQGRSKIGHRRLASRMPLQLKESSSIAAAEYDRNRRTLRVRFSPGGVYDYLDVPAAVVREFSQCAVTRTFRQLAHQAALSLHPRGLTGADQQREYAFSAGTF